MKKSNVPYILFTLMMGVVMFASCVSDEEDDYSAKLCICKQWKSAKGEIIDLTDRNTMIVAAKDPLKARSRQLPEDSYFITGRGRYVLKLNPDGVSGMLTVISEEDDDAVVEFKDLTSSSVTLTYAEDAQDRKHTLVDPPVRLYTNY